LIVLGALVRAHGAGLACPDWPLCFGQVLPTFDLRVGFEWTHRAVAGSVALSFACLAVATLRAPASRRAVGAWLAAAAALLGLQILLGALTVWQLLAAWTVTAHLVTGNAFAVTLLVVAVRLRRAGQAPRHERASPRARFALAAGAVLLFAQIVLGGLVASSYSGLACPDWPSCRGGAWFPSLEGPVGLHLLHRTTGYLVVLVLAGLALRARRPPGLRRALAASSALALLQVAVGIANVLTRLPVEVTGLHSALAAALVLTTSFAVHEAFAG
jgi:cytochrome c oxidase assembly protein subunit 15